MTAHILITDLTALFQESKRKNPELKQAAEISLNDIKGLQQTSEKQIAADLSRRPQFINPFIIACSSKNARFAGVGMSCLQRLVVSQGLSASRLNDVVEAITECTSLGLDIQLKILQTLPALLQNYSEQVGGKTLFTILQICSTLQASKTPSVSSTSAATLQQLVTSVYDKLTIEDKRSVEVPTVSQITVGEEKVSLRTVAFDAYRVFHDLCMLLEGSKPRFIRFSSTSEPALLETIESIFTGYGSLIRSHCEQAHLVQSILIPRLTKLFSDKATFATTVRVTRLLYLIVKHFIDMFPEGVETILQWFNHGLDPEATILWKRILCMEVFREIYTDHQLILQIHEQFNGQDDSTAIIPHSLASFVRLASEKPALIGLSQQSSVPVGNYFQRDSSTESVDQLSNVPSTGSAGVPTLAVPGISAQFSSIKTPCIEQLDKQEAPNIPETYVYSLVLGSLNNLSESLAKFILPLTIASTKSKRRPRSGTGTGTQTPDTESLHEIQTKSSSVLRRNSRRSPVNPLGLTEHSNYGQIKTAAKLIDQSWPAVLACCSTFLNAALDADNYRSLVRSFQKFAQVAGLLHMSVPRDAFLTTLGKSTMPTNLMTAGIVSAGSQPPPTPSFLSNAKGLLNVESIVSQASSFLPDRRRTSVDTAEPSLNVRNLLCLRALLNLAIALGPTLQTSWTIVFETLQQADRVLASPAGRAFQSSLSSTGPEGSQSQQIASEVTAVQAAASRLFESTTDLSNEAFVSALKSLSSLVDIKPFETTTSTRLPSVNSPPSPTQHRRIASFSGLSVKTGSQEHDFIFTMTKLRELASLNLERFLTENDDTSSGWNMLIEHLSLMVTSFDVPANARLLAMDIVRQLILDCIAQYPADGEDREIIIQSKAVLPLSKLSITLKNIQSSSNEADEAISEAHIIVLESLRGLLEQIGDVLESGWPAVFDTVKSSFYNERTQKDDSVDRHLKLDLLSVTLGRSAFSSLQLICSDFLSSKLDTTMSSLIDLLYHFASQEQDINISLTTTTFYWNVSDYLYTGLSPDTLNNLATTNENDLVEIDLKTLDRMSDSKDFAGVIWLYLLKRLADLIADPRQEVRNGAIHTIFRIFDNHGNDLTPIVWQLCIKAILSPILIRNAESYDLDLGKTNTSTSEPLDNKADTSKVLLEGFCKLLAGYLSNIRKATGFLDLWNLLVKILSSYLDLDIHQVTAAVWQALDIVVSKASEISDFGTGPVDAIFSIWLDRLPSAKSELDSNLNIEAFESYASSFISIYEFRKTKVTKDETRAIVQNLESCVRKSDCPSYTTDLDSLTTLHQRVIKCLSLLRVDLKGTTSMVLTTLSRFMSLPFEVASKEKKAGLTYIALSKASMDLIQKLIHDEADWDDIFDSDCFELVLSNLAKSIAVKYLWQKQGRSPPIWKRAVQTSILVLQNSISKMFQAKIGSEMLESFWESIVVIFGNIAHSDTAPDVKVTNEMMQEDEQFDIESLEKLNGLIIPSLGSPKLSDNLRRSHCNSLLTVSFIHKPEPRDIRHINTDLLGGLYDKRYGRTYDPELSPRPEMALFCFRLLLDLLRKQESTTEQVKLAKAAAPYVIVRAAMPLQAYIADQPLRGGLPMQETQIYELITILRELKQLRCERSAIPPTDKGVGDEGGHLIRLFPLVAAAAKVKNGPDEVKEELFAWFGQISGELGLPTI